MEPFSTLSADTLEDQEEALVAYLEAVEAGRPESARALLEKYPDLDARANAFRDHEKKLDRLFAPLCPALPAREPLPPGTWINDYEVLEFLSRGGMGVVYRARQRRPCRDVALKMLPRGLAASPEPARRLFVEAEHAARLEHPNIVPVYEVGEYQGEPYFSMKLVRGGSLAQLPPGLADRPDQVALLLVAIARAVHYAHQRGLLHRDLKPANILLDEGPARDIPLVADFGLAQHVGAVSEGAAGTLSYMAPEQARGEKVLTVAVDVYGLGTILYELLTGRPPFRSTTERNIIELVLAGDPEPPHVSWPKVHRDLEAICLKCLKKDPAQRYGSAEELAGDLERFLHHKPVKARPRSVAGALGLWARRQPALALLLPVLLVLCVLGVSFLIQVGKAGTAEANRERVQYNSTINQAAQTYDSGQPDTARALLDSCPAERRHWEYHYLRRACRQQVVTLAGHDGQVLRVRYNPDGKLLATAADDGRVGVWDTRTGQLRFLLAVQPDGGAVSACFTPEGKHLLTAGDRQGKIEQWDVATGKERQEVKGPRGQRVIVAGKGGVAASLDRDGNKQALWVWSLGKEGAARRLELPAERKVIDFALSPDGRYLAACGFSELLLVWDTESAKPPRTFSVPTWAGWTDIWAVTFSADGKRLAAAGLRPLEWDVQTAKPLGTPYIGTGELTCSSLDFGIDPPRLAATYRDGQVRVWDAHTRRAVLAPPRCPLQVTSATFSPDGKHLAWTRGREVVIENLASPTIPPEQLLKGHQDRAVWAVAFSPDGCYLASRSTTEVVLWDRDKKALVWRGKLEKVIASEVSLVFSPDGRRVVTGGKGDWLQEFEVDGGKAVPLPIPAASTRFLAAGKASRGVPPAGGLLATTDGGSSVVVWNSEGGRRCTLKDAGVGEVRGLAFAPDNRRLAVCGSQGLVKVWDLSASPPRLLRECRDRTGSIWSVTFSPDGQRLATGGVSGIVRLWEVATGQELFTLAGHNGNVNSVAFSPDGQRLASACVDGRIKLWDPRTGQEVLTLQGHTNVTCACFSPDGRLPACCGHDGQVRLWDGRP